MKISLTQTETVIVTKKLRHRIEIETSFPYERFFSRVWRMVTGMFS